MTTDLVARKVRVLKSQPPNPAQEPWAALGFVEIVGERGVVAGFGEVVPRWWIRGEEGIANAKPVVEDFPRQ